MANYTINLEETIGKFVPNIYISRITLENNAGFALGRFQKNPHIDPNASEVAAGIVEGETSSRPTATAGKLTVSLQITVKDIVGENFNKWFSNANTSLVGSNTLKDYIRIQIAQVTTESALTAWTKFTTDPHSMLRGTILTQAGTSLKFFDLKDFEAEAGRFAGKYQEHDSQGNRCVNSSLIVKSSDFTTNTGVVPLDDNPATLAYFAWAEVNTEKLADDFRLFGQTIGPLAAASYSATIGKINSNIVFRNSKLVRKGHIFLEAQPGSPPAGLPLNKTDRLWNGEVQYIRAGTVDVSINGVLKRYANYTGFLGGKNYIPGEDITKQPFLIQQTVPNTKIIDFRIVEDIEKLNLNFSKLENKLLRLINKKTRDIKSDTNFSFFTDISLSRGKRSDCRFFFGIDLKKIMRENSPFGGLYARPVWLQNALTEARILSMRIYRRRVRGSSEGGSTPYNFPGDHHFDPVGKLKKFDNALKRNDRNFDLTAGGQTTEKGVSYDPADELIIEAYEVNRTRTSVQFNNDYRPNNKSSIETVNNIFGAPEGTYYYTGTDGGMSEITDGYYQYRIELEILDNSVEYLINVYNDVLGYINRLEEYFVEGSKAGRNVMNTAHFEDAHTTEQNDTRFRTQEANFDPISNRFTQRFIDAQSGQWPSNLPQQYLNKLKLFVDLNDAVITNELVPLLQSYINPQSGNLQGCLVFLRLLQDLVSFLVRAIGVQIGTPKSTPTDTEDAVNATGQTATIFESNIEKSITDSSHRRKFKISHVFETYFNANLPEKVGYDYLGMGMNGSSEFITAKGLRIITADFFKNTIVPKEKAKIFKSGPQNIELYGLEDKGLTGMNNSLNWTDFSYLTPSIIYVGPNKKFHTITDTNGLRPNLSSADIINNTLFGTGIAENVTVVKTGAVAGSLLSTDSLQEKVADFLAYNYNLSVISPDLYRVKITTPANPPIESPTLRGINATKSYVNRANIQTWRNNRAFNCLWSFIGSGIVSGNKRGGVATPGGFSQKTISYYDAKSSTGFYDRLPTTGNRAVEIINDLPNSIRALIRYNDQTRILQGSQATNPFLADIETYLAASPFIEPTTRAKSRLMFETINTIEVLTEFEETKYGAEKMKLEISEHTERGRSDHGSIGSLDNIQTVEESLGAPKWETLTRTIFNQADNKVLLCRQRAWSNPIFKVERVPGLSLPTFDEYFLLWGGGAGASSNPPRLNPDPPIKEGGDTMAVETVKEVDFVLDVKTDYIATTLDLKNLDSSPFKAGALVNPLGGRPAEMAAISATGAGKSALYGKSIILGDLEKTDKVGKS